MDFYSGIVIVYLTELLIFNIKKLFKYEGKYLNNLYPKIGIILEFFQELLF